MGPTAVGKTGLALALGQRFSAEVVSADSRQIYRHMDVGTAKPRSEERARVPHHLLDVVEPGDTSTLAEYQDMAFRAIRRHHGTGQSAIASGRHRPVRWAVLENRLSPASAP